MSLSPRLCDFCSTNLKQPPAGLRAHQARYTRHRQKLRFGMTSYVAVNQCFPEPHEKFNHGGAQREAQRDENSMISVVIFTRNNQPVASAHNSRSFIALFISLNCMCLANHKITQISTRFPGIIGKSECCHCIHKFYRRARGERRGLEWY